MGIRDEYAQSVAEIRTARRDAEQAAQREVAALRKEIEAAAERLGRLDAEQEEALARVRQEFQLRRAELEGARTATEASVATWNGKSHQARRESEEKLARRALWAAREAERLLTATEAQIRALAESRRRREELLATNPESARIYAEHGQVRGFLQSIEGAGQLPATALTAVVAALRADLRAKESHLAKAGVPLDPGGQTTGSELLMLYDVSDPTGGTIPEIHVLVPCLYSRFDEPALESPPLTLRIAAGIVRTVAEIQQAMCTMQVPVLYARADDMLLIRGPLTEHAAERETAEMLESELQSAVREIAKQTGATIDPVALQLGPGVVGTFLQNGAAEEQI